MNTNNSNNNYKNNYLNILNNGHKNLEELKRNIELGMTFQRYMNFRKTRGENKNEQYKKS